MLRIPTGCNINHFMTNCSLYSYVEIWMQRAKRKRLAKAGKYNDVSRFVDNFITVSLETLYI